MTQPRSAAMGAAQSATITQPGWLLQVGADNRWCSRGSLFILGATWIGADFRVEGLGAGGNLAAGARITWFDADDAIVTLLLSDQLADKPAEIWLVDGAATADDDPMFESGGVLDAVEHDPARGTVTAELALPTRLPWPFYGPAMGMTKVVPAGTQLRAGPDVWTVERRR